MEDGLPKIILTVVALIGAVLLAAKLLTSLFLCVLMFLAVMIQ